MAFKTTLCTVIVDLYYHMTTERGRELVHSGGPFPRDVREVPHAVILSSKLRNCYFSTYNENDMSKVFVLPHETPDLLNQWGHLNGESTQRAIK